MPVDLVAVPVEQLEQLARLGVDVTRVLGHANIATSRFEATKAHLTTSEFFALWRAIEELGAPRDLGLRMGSETAPHQQSVASLAALCSPTVGEAFNKLARYKRLVCPEQVTIHVVRGEARLRFEWLLANEDPPALLIDGIFAHTLALARLGTGKPIVPRRVELTRRRSDEPMLTRHFGCKIRFDAPSDLLVFDGAVLDEPFTTHNQALLELIVPGLESALQDSALSRSLSDDVRLALGQQIRGERPAVQKVAKALGLSARTLQRRLEALGTSYQRLLDDVRHRSARRLLASTDLDSGEVAFLLGFEELNSFTRAFQGWEGTTPNRWRAASHRKAVPRDKAL